MGWKDGNGLGKYRQGTTTTLRANYRSSIMGMADKVNGKDSGRRAWWQRCETKGIHIATEEMRDDNRRCVGRQRRQNGSEER